MGYFCTQQTSYQHAYHPTAPAGYKHFTETLVCTMLSPPHKSTHEVHICLNSTTENMQCHSCGHPHHQKTNTFQPPLQPCETPHRCQELAPTLTQEKKMLSNEERIISAQEGSIAPVKFILRSTDVSLLPYPSAATKTKYKVGTLSWRIHTQRRPISTICCTPTEHQTPKLYWCCRELHTNPPKW